MASPTPAKYTTCLLDMDGVLAEVSQSYRAAILATCRCYGAKSVSHETISDWKARGGCNNDWQLSHDLIMSSEDGRKEGLTLEQVTETFEKFYQGDGTTAGFCETETLIPNKETLEQLAKRSTGGLLGIVTGRPRSDCEKFLKLHKLDNLIKASVCMEDGPPKPDPFAVIRACELMGVNPGPGVILVGDTPDDIRAAVAAGCRGVAVATPEAVAASLARGDSFDSSKLCIAMKECGADLVLHPGFADLVDMFAAPLTN
jgi:HAD superfamily hydrolase (TIGR01548 family)